MRILLLLIIFTKSVYSEELRMMVWDGYAPRDKVEIFKKIVKKKYDLNINVSVMNPSDPEDFFDALRSNKADIVSPAHNLPKSYKWSLIENGLVLPLELNNIPNYAKVIKQLQNAEYISYGDKVYGAPFTYGPYGLAYNKKLNSKEPSSWSIFLKDDSAGKYAISADYYEANIYLVALAMGMKGDDIFKMEKINTLDFKNNLKKLFKNAGKAWTGVDKVEDLKGLSFATSWGFALPDLKKQGEHWSMSTPIEGTTGWVDNLMIGKSLKDKPLLKSIAEEWINFSLSEEMQIHVVRGLGSFPVVSSIKKSLTKEEVKYFQLDNPNFFKDNLILWKVLDRRTHNFFESMYQEIKNSK